MKKLFLTAAAILAAVGLLYGCKSTKALDNIEKPTGRYLEEALELPEWAGSVLAIKELNNGQIILIDYYDIYISEDKGSKWRLSEHQMSLREANQNSEGGAYDPDAATVDAEGNVFLAYSDYSDEGEGFVQKYLYMNGEGQEQEVELELPEISGIDWEASGWEEPQENYLCKSRFLTDNLLAAANTWGSLYLIDTESWEVIREIGGDGSYQNIEDFIYNNNKLIVKWNEDAMFHVYDLATGEEENLDKALTDVLKAQNNVNGDVSGTTLFGSLADDSFYYADETGIFKYTFGASQIEMLVNGELTSLSNQEYYFSKMEPLSDGKFLMISENYNSNESSVQLLRYEYSEDSYATPEIELTIYTLLENALLRQAVSTYQARYPECYIKVEVGIEGESSVTLEDALKKLNTRILAGEGPDILMLDGLPIETYEEKGILEDISELVTEVTDEQEYFDNILYAYEREEALYAVPTRFYLPLISGPEKDIAAVKDTKSLADKTARLRKSNSKLPSVLNENGSGLLSYQLFHWISEDILKEDGTINKSVLKEYYEQLADIYDKNTLNKKELDDKGEMGYLLIENTQYQPENLVMEIIGDRQAMYLTTLTDMDDFNYVLTYNYEKGWDYQLIASGEMFVPSETIGINAASENKQHSKEFLKFLMADEMQRKEVLNYHGGLPINRFSFENIWRSYLRNTAQSGSNIYKYTNTSGYKDGKMVEIGVDVRCGNQENYLRLEGEIMNLQRPIIKNKIISDIIIEEGAKCMIGKTSPEESTEEVIRKININLAEQ